MVTEEVEDGYTVVSNFAVNPESSASKWNPFHKKNEIEDVSSSPWNKFKSIPIFLPNTVKYDPETNEVTPLKDDTLEDDDESEEEEEIEDEREELVIVPNAGYDFLHNVIPQDKPVSFISCIGPYRTGKSMLLSRFLRDSKAFALGPTLEGCTRGMSTLQQ